jgi:hypothetical protein
VPISVSIELSDDAAELLELGQVEPGFDRPHNGRPDGVKLVGCHGVVLRSTAMRSMICRAIMTCLVGDSDPNSVIRTGR